MMLSPHFMLDEFTVSETAARFGVNNDPPPEAIENLRRVALFLESVRTVVGVPVVVSSGYRSPSLNIRVGGAKDSAHMRGLAADFTAPAFGSPLELVRVIMGSPFLMSKVDQMIYEFGRWVHVAVPPKDGEPKMEVLTIRSKAEGYLPGLVA